jgi:dolichol-phosphate mannosyltransferase
MTLSPETVTKDRVSQIISIITILIFNQQSKISYSLEKIKQAVESVFNSYELIVVNDGSTDNTIDYFERHSIMDPHIRVLSYTPNRGKGYAVRQGVLQSHGDAVMFLDGDFDISPDSIKDYYIERLSTSDLVVASKRHPKSSVTIPKSRAFLSRAFNLLIKMARGIIPQKDTKAGFKVGNGEIRHTIFRGVTVNRYAFNVELFTIASIVHLKVQEMPIVMKIDRQLNTKEIVNMFVDVTYEFVTDTESFMLTRKNWRSIYQLHWKIRESVSTRWFCSIAKYY